MCIILLKSTLAFARRKVMRYEALHRACEAHYVPEKLIKEISLAREGVVRGKALAMTL